MEEKNYKFYIQNVYLRVSGDVVIAYYLHNTLLHLSAIQKLSVFL